MLYTTKQQNIINELHDFGYFYSMSNYTFENVRLDYKVSKDYMGRLIQKELENIRNNWDEKTIIWQRHFGPFGA